MTYGEFYRRAGRPELAEKRDARWLASDLLYWGGIATVLGGFVLTVDSSRTADGKLSTQGWVGLGMVGGGVGGIVASVNLGSHVVTVDEAQALAASYNAELRRHGVELPRGRQASRLRLQPSFGPQIAGSLLSGTF